METKITVIVDNKSNEGIAGEWGLSFLVEYTDEKILLDTVEQMNVGYRIVF